MPLFSRKSTSFNATIILWKIDESEEELKKGIILSDDETFKLDKITHPHKRKEFLALRCCLKEFYGQNPEVHYHDTGKPYLVNGDYVSFSHTKNFAGIIQSTSANIGLDLELKRERILRIAHKFMSDIEEKSIDEKTRIEHLTYYWGAKEVLVKITGNRHLNFIQQLHIKPFKYKENTKTTGKVVEQHLVRESEIHFEKMDELYLTYGYLKD